MKVAVLILFLFTYSQSVFAEQKIPKGELADPVSSAFDPTQTHAVYLPPNYTPEKKWPILFCYEPRSRGRIPIELFREAAERLGWILISSNHYLSDDPNAKNFDVLKAMWSDAHKWFSVDERRVYATGFSGGARISWGMDSVLPKAIAGVIGVGAGGHPDVPPTKQMNFIWYGITGNKDFNYLEVRSLEERLDALDIPHRVEYFDGRHEWPPAEYCSRALDWMELQAMKQNRRSQDPEWIRTQFSARLQHAQNLESSGKLLEAFENYISIRKDFESLVDLASVQQKISALKGSEAIQKAIKDRRKVEEREQQFVASLVETIGNFRNSPDPISAGKLRSDLNVTRWLKEAKNKANTEEGLTAQRLLETIATQTSFYLPQYFLGKKDYNRTLVSLTVAADIRPESPWVWYSFASVHALKGDTEDALKNLQIAVDRGLSSRKYIDEEKSFDSLRNNSKFQEIVSKLSSE